MNTLQFNFTIAFLKRNRALLDLLSHERMKYLIEDAFKQFNEDQRPWLIDTWFSECYTNWATSFCNDWDVEPNIRAALLHD